MPITQVIFRRLLHPLKITGFAMTISVSLLLMPQTVKAAEKSAAQVLESISVQHNGRVKPFLAFARESVLTVTGKTSFERIKPTELIWRWMGEPAKWSMKRMLPIDDAKIRAHFKADLLHGRVAPQNVLVDMDFLKEVQTVQAKQQKKETLNGHEKSVVELYGRARLFESIASGQMPGLVPHPDNPTASWLAPGVVLGKEGEEILTSFYPGPQVQTLRSGLSYLLTKIQEQGFSLVDPAAENFANGLQGLLDSRSVILDQGPLNTEIIYWKLRPFHLAWMLYFLSAALIYFFRKDGFKLKCAVGVYGLGFALHTLGFIMRIVIAGRPPVTNMYESVIWVSWGVILCSFILWLVYKSSEIPMIASMVAGLALIIGENLPAVLDASINPLVPVLRSNFWLTIHVLTITLGYGAFALNWGVAHTLLYQMAYGAKKQQLAQLIEFLYRSLQIGVILLTAGTILGGVWASYSWGRFWGWDPKETWALIAILTYLAVLHGRIAGWLDSFGVAFWSAISFLTIIMAWYGVNFVLGVGLHSYGFGGGGLAYVLAVVAVDLIVLLFFASRYRIKSYGRKHSS